ncbi:unnamed protein product [Protopolystoma xenopodis]|uniref:Uncharacterized protein n=1 Tax=Protopolystoma xenopodis TaxID=117903 RepID=A0A448WSE7_9PLAT|nr:unnamed protein product [Protopolystoma xenopodis]
MLSSIPSDLTPGSLLFAAICMIPQGILAIEFSFEKYPQLLSRVRRESGNQTNSGNGLSSGAIAAAIVVPIVSVILILALILLFCWFRKRRSSHGVYNPGPKEDLSIISTQKLFQDVLKMPPEERLI